MMREMKESGIEWIGRIPEEWEVIPHKFIMHKEKNIKEHYEGEPILSLTMNGVIVRDLNAGGKMPLTFDGYQIVHAGNLLMCLFDIDVTPRCVGLVNNEGITSPAYSNFVMHQGVYAPYYNYLIRYMDDIKCMLHLSKNLRNSLTETDFGAINSILPPYDEQRRIATFLDNKCSEVDQLISLQEQFIEELKAYKQSVITEAVTKGLNPEVEMKESGVEWIGRIPKEWKVSRVGLHYNIILGRMLCPKPLDETYTLEKYYCAANVHFEGITGELKQMWFSSQDKSIYKTKKDDLLIVEGGAGAGGCAILEESNEDIYIQNSIMIARPKRDNNCRYLKYLIEQLVKKGYIDIVCNKATIPHFTKEKVSNVPFLVMPPNEQRAIATYLDTKCAEIDSLIALKQQKIDALKDYKKSMIYEYVTGKKQLD